MRLPFFVTKYATVASDASKPNTRNHGVELKYLSNRLPINAKVTVGTAMVMPISDTNDTACQVEIPLFSIGISGILAQRVYKFSKLLSTEAIFLKTAG